MTHRRALFGLGLGTALLAALAPALAAPRVPLSDRERRLRERTSDAVLERRVDDLLARLTLEEKIGQMAMVNVVEDVPDESRPYPPGFPTVSPARLDQLFGRYPVGFVMSDIALAPEAWVRFVGELQRAALERSRAKVPVLYAVCHMHGAGFVQGATIFPHNIGLAATFDPRFARDAGEVTAIESAPLGHGWLYTPVVDTGRDPRWGRFYETLGESPLLVSAMGAAIVRGVQETKEAGPVRQTASLKHFLAYSDPRSGLDRTPALVPDQRLYELFVPPFRAGIEAGVGIVETNSGEVNGVPVHASRRLLTTLLRDELGFRGVLNTDWEDVRKLATVHRVAESEKEAAFLAVGAGHDLVLTPYDTLFCDHLAALVREGRVSRDRIDLSVARLLRLKLKLGLFEHSFPSGERLDRIGSAPHREKAREAARESLVLLRNEGVLPLDPSRVKALVVTGPNADSRRALAGGWTVRWSRPAEAVLPPEVPTVFQALAAQFPRAEVWHATTSDGVRWRAASADAIVYVAGEEPYAEGTGPLDDLTLPADQLAGIEAAVATSRPVVLVLVAGRPRVITRVFDRCAAVVWAGLPGFEGGTAIAELAAGAFNPSGRLPFAYPAAPSRIVPYDHKPSEESAAGPTKSTIADYGSGLSYTTFAYRDLALSKTALRGAGDGLVASVTVTNTGARAGRHAVLWFLTDEVGSITRPVRQLAHFEKVALAPGESRTLAFAIEAGRDLSFPGERGEALLEPGSFTLAVGGRSARFRYEGSSPAR